MKIYKKNFVYKIIVNRQTGKEVVLNSLRSWLPSGLSTGNYNSINRLK